MAQQFEVVQLQQKVRQLRKQFYDKDSTDKYQIRLRNLITQSKDGDIDVELLMRKAIRIEKKLNQQMNIEELTEEESEVVQAQKKNKTREVVQDGIKEKKQKRKNQNFIEQEQVNEVEEVEEVQEIVRVKKNKKVKEEVEEVVEEEVEEVIKEKKQKKIKKQVVQEETEDQEVTELQEEEKVIQKKIKLNGDLDNQGTQEQDVQAQEITARGQMRGNVTILLFYAYVKPQWSKYEQDAVINYTYNSLQKNGCSGRLRVAREGLNSVITGTYEGIRAFTTDLKQFQPHNFAQTDFKYVDRQPDNHMLRELKVWPVTELVTYGFNATQAQMERGGKHLTPTEFHNAMELPNTVIIDVRNFNETVIGKFNPPGSKLLDPCMRKSTEFPAWVDKNLPILKGKKILMYCTGGIRCEKASAFLNGKGLTDINQLEGGIHRYLDEFPQDGGYWVGKNYTFDKRFSHGAIESEVISQCVVCTLPWERYQANLKCSFCKMEILVCKTCVMNKKTVPISKAQLMCPLCRFR